MAYTRQNPYIELDQLREELKMKPEDIPAGSAIEDDLLRAIDHASRWVDDYTRRDYFFHDHSVVPLLLDNFDGGVYGREIFLRWPILGVASINGDGTAMESTDYVVKQGDELNRIIGTFGNWFGPGRFWTLNSSARRTVEIFGTFGYLQNSSYPVTIAGDTAGQLSAFSLFGNVVAPVFWTLDSPAANVARVRLYSNSAHTALIAEGKALDPVTSINLWPAGGSGISGSGNVEYTGDDTDTANVFTPGAGVYDSRTVPLGIPGRITLATRLVAAAISGRNRKEMVDVQGQKTSIMESEIPKTVFQILGRRAPILV